MSYPKLALTEIDFQTILPIWETQLWPNRQTKIESHSATLLGKDPSMTNFSMPAWYYGMYAIPSIANQTKLVGVNSVHLCADGSSRIRGFWVDEDYRRKGIGLSLLTSTLDRSKESKVSWVWAYPRKTSWPLFEKLGFRLVTPWSESETSPANAYCILQF